MIFCLLETFYAYILDVSIGKGSVIKVQEPHLLVISSFCATVVSCDGFHLFVVKRGFFEVVVILFCENRDKIQNVLKDYTSLSNDFDRFLSKIHKFPAHHLCAICFIFMDILACWSLLLLKGAAHGQENLLLPSTGRLHSTFGYIGKQKVKEAFRLELAQNFQSCVIIVHCLQK